ncbi:MAG: ATPase domain-containing protein [candidate division WOR-3 bacterium]
MNRSRSKSLNGLIYEKVSSGIEILDRIWGGFYKGRGYLVIGPQGSGKTILGVQFLLAGLKQGERCVFITGRRIEDLILQLESFGFEVKKYIDTDQLRFLKYPTPLFSDKVAVAVNGVVSYLESEEIQRLVLDTVMPLIITDLKEFRNLIEDMLYRLEGLGVSTLMTIREPANREASKVINLLEELTTGVIQFTETPTGRRISFIAKWGYPPPVFSYNYKIVPSQGIVIGNEREEEVPLARRDKKRFKLLPFNNFLSLIVKQIGVPEKPQFSIVGLKFPSMSQRVIEAVELLLSEPNPATIYENSVLILLCGIRKKEAEVFSKELSARIKSILPLQDFETAVVTFPQDGEDLDELLSKIT